MVDSVLRQFHDTGFVILRDFLKPTVLTSIQRDLELWVDIKAKESLAAGFIDTPLNDLPFATRLLHIYANCLDQAPSILRHELHWPGMFELFFYEPLLDIVEQVLGMEIRLYPNYSVRPKLPGHAPTLVLWHQDVAYTASGQHGTDDAAPDIDATELNMINVWTPLVPARRENGCMQFVPGSHKLGLVAHEKRQYYLEIDAAEITPRLGQAVDIVCDPGDIVLFSNMLFHRGLPNLSDIVRWSCDWRYQDARQSTMRQERGHMARSQQRPQEVITSAAMWTSRSFV